MRTFNINQPETWFNRNTRLIAARVGYGTHAHDVVSQTITTPFSTPHWCYHEPAVGNHHVWDRFVLDEPGHTIYGCGKCGARQEIRTRPMPSQWRVLLGQRAAG